MHGIAVLCHVRLFVIPWTVAQQAPLFMEFSRQEYWSGLPLPSPGDLPNPGIEPRSLELQEDSSPSEPPGKLKEKQQKKNSSHVDASASHKEARSVVVYRSTKVPRLHLEKTSKVIAKQIVH